MKKFLTILLVFLLTGCSYKPTNDTSSLSNSSNIRGDKAFSEKEDIYKGKLLVSSIPYEENWENDKLDEIGLNGTIIKQAEQSKTVDKLKVYLFCDFKYDDALWHDSYLAVENEKDVKFISLAYKDTIATLATLFYLCDVDGDSVDEIVLQQTTGMSGGAGQYLSRVFKISESGINEIFNSQNFDTGFSGNFCDDFSYKIQNDYTGHSDIITLDDIHKTYFFDGEGNLIKSDNFLCDSFREFIPEDVDKDGVFEIRTTQYTSLIDHADYIGDAKCVLKFDLQKQGFKVIQSSFTKAEMEEIIIVENDGKFVSTKLIQDFLLASEVKPFEEGDTVAVDPFLKYFQFSELLTDKSEVREIYSSYKVGGSSDSFSIPKKIVHEQLKKHFSVNFDDSNSTFQDKDNKDCYYLRSWVLGSDSTYQGNYIKEEKVDSNKLLCTYDKMSKKSYYVGDSECPEYEFTKIGEMSLLIENPDTPEYKVIYYKEKNI